MPEKGRFCPNSYRGAGKSELIEAEVVKDHDSLTGLARGETLFFRPKVWQKAADI